MVAYKILKYAREKPLNVFYLTYYSLFSNKIHTNLFTIKEEEALLFGDKIVAESIKNLLTAYNNTDYIYLVTEKENATQPLKDNKLMLEQDERQLLQLEIFNSSFTQSLSANQLSIFVSSLITSINVTEYPALAVQLRKHFKYDKEVVTNIIHYLIDTKYDILANEDIITFTKELKSPTN